MTREEFDRQFENFINDKYLLMEQFANDDGTVIVQVNKTVDDKDTDLKIVDDTYSITYILFLNEKEYTTPSYNLCSKEDVIEICKLLVIR